MTDNTPEYFTETEEVVEEVEAPQPTTSPDVVIIEDPGPAPDNSETVLDDSEATPETEEDGA